MPAWWTCTAAPASGGWPRWPTPPVASSPSGPGSPPGTASTRWASTAAWRWPRPAGTTAPRPRSGSAAAARLRSLKPTPRILEWELTELQISAILDEPDGLGPHHRRPAGALPRQPGRHPAVLYRLVQMGLVQPVADPNHPGQVLLDTRILDQLVATYGPRVTTASGELGVAAGRGEIWTPETARGGAAIWTPGSEAAPAPAAGQERSRLILPGQ